MHFVSIVEFAFSEAEPQALEQPGLTHPDVQEYRDDQYEADDGVDPMLR
jgi:hypothetical protein